jgi:drug/metabolite transporter (DMT)-like permease
VTIKLPGESILLSSIIHQKGSGQVGINSRERSLRTPILTQAIRPRHIAELFLLSFIWGSAYLFTRSAVPEFGPAPLIALRMGIAVVVLLPLVVARGLLPMLLANAKLLAIQGSIFTCLSFLLIAWSALSISAGLSAILSATAPMFGAVVAWIFLKERIQGWRLLGLALGFAGVSILAWGKVSLRMDASSVKVSLAVLAGLSSSLLWGMAANFSRQKLSAISPLVTTVGTMLAATVFMLPFAWLDWQASSQQIPHPMPSLKACAEALFLGIVCSGLGMLMYFRLLREIGTVPTMSVTFMSPVVAIALGAWYLNEAITLQIVLGCIVVLLGTGLSVGLFPRSVPSSNLKK